MLELVSSNPFGDVRKYWKEEVLWQLAMRFRRSNLSIAGAFNIKCNLTFINIRPNQLHLLTTSSMDLPSTILCVAQRPGIIFGMYSC